MSGAGAGPRSGLRARLDPRIQMLPRLLPPLVWMGLIYWVSDRPDIPSAPAPLWDFVLKKSLHALAYAILLGLWWRALKPVDPLGGAGIRALLVALAITLLWAASDEWHQTFVPGRSGRVRDVMIDGAGALAAAAWIHRRWSRADAPAPPGPRTPRSPGARPSPASDSGDSTA